MTVLTDLLLKRAGLHGDQSANGEGPNIPPFILNILEKYGITPDAIKNYAETFKTVITEKLNSIDEHLNDIACTLDVYGEQQEEILARLTALELSQTGTSPAAPLPDEAFEHAGEAEQSWPTLTIRETEHNG